MPADITPDDLNKEARDALVSLPKDLARLVAVHLVAAERALAEEDAELAYEHTKAARRFGSRVGVVREAAGIAAYRAGHFAEALNDLRAARRLMGADDLLPVLADCERGLGRPERALDLARSPEADRAGRAVQIELAIVESGARRDLGQKEAAIVTLQRLPELRDNRPRPWSARLAYAYADALADAGHDEAAVEWFERAMEFDEDGETDAALRYAELTGTPLDEIDDIEDDDERLDGDERADDEDSGQGADPGREAAWVADDAPGERGGAGSSADADVVRDEVTENDSRREPGDAPADLRAGSGGAPGDADAEASEAVRPGDAGEVSGDGRVPEPGADAASPEEPVEGREPGRTEGTGGSAAPGESADHDSDEDARGEAEPGSEDDRDPSGPVKRPEEAQPGESAGAGASAASSAEGERDLKPAFIEPDFAGGEDAPGATAPGKREVQERRAE